MKKLIFMLLGVLCCGNAFASAAMCVKPNVTAVVMDPEIGGSALSSSSALKTWSTTFPYGVISGIASCYSNVGTGVATNQTMLNQNTTGTFCYCKILRPVVSKWVYAINVGNGNTCASDCASVCASRAGSVAALRRGLFGSIEM